MHTIRSKLKQPISKLFRKQTVRNFSGVAIANLVATTITLVVMLVVPKVVSIEDYSYWQLYVFYVGYVGVLHLGIADGIYLRYGGRRYSDLNRDLLRSQLFFVVILQIVACAIIISLGGLLFQDVHKQTVALLVGSSLLLINVRTFLQMVLQATNRMVDFSKNLIYERIVYVALIGLVLVVGYRDFDHLISADLIAKGVMLLMLLYVCRDIVFGKLEVTRRDFLELWKNLSAGAKLMTANIAGILIVGVVRLIVEARWGVTTFGEVSLVLTAANITSIFITAAGVVIYPALKRTKIIHLARLYRDLRQILIPCMLLFLVLYFPIHFLLSRWLPQYLGALQYLPLLFPLAFYEAKTQILTNTFLKARRKEGSLLIINLLCLGLAGIAAYTTAFVIGSLELTLLIVVLVLALRSLLSEHVLTKAISGAPLFGKNCAEFCLVTIFIIAAYFGLWYVTILYVTILCLVPIASREKILLALRRSIMK